MPDPDRDQTVHAQAVLADVIDEWMARRGVVAIEVARRRRDGVPTNEVAIRVTVERKLPVADVPDGELFPRSIEDVPVQVVEGSRPSLEGSMG